MSSLPGWIGQPPSVTVTVRDSPYKAGWRATGVYYSAVVDPLLPPEPGVLEAIREFYPEAQYVREIKTYKTPSQRTTFFVRHAVASYVAQPRSKKPPFRIDIPEAYPYPRPNMLDFVVQHGFPEAGNHALPGAYAAWSWGLVPYLRSIFDTRSARERQNLYIRKVLEERARQQDAAARAWDEQTAADMKHWQKRLDTISDVEYDEYLRGLNTVRKARQKEWMIAMERRKEAAPKVMYLGGGRKDH